MPTATGGTSGCGPSPSPSPSPATTCLVSGATGATGTSVHPADQSPYNAVGDGLTDDYQAIQKDIDDTSASGGGVVTLGAGTYLTSGHLVLRTNVKLVGAGNGLSATPTIIKAGPKFLGTSGPQGGYPVITTTGATNVTIADLEADQSGDTLFASNLNDRLAGYLIDVRNSSNALVDGVSTRNPFTYSIAAVGSNHFCIRGSDTRVATSGLYDQLDGIHVLDSAFGDVDNNAVDQRYLNSTDGDDALVAHTINGTTHDISYSNNKARGGARGDGMQIAVGNYAIYNITITNNEIYDSPEGIRTGYYDNQTGAVHDITLGGGTSSGNYVHDLRGGIAFPTGGNAVWLFTSGSNGSLSNLNVQYNTACNAGQLVVDAGSNVVVANNTVSSTSC
jgi:Pectate lyase superfamily protein